MFRATLHGVKSDNARGEFGIWLRKERRARFGNVPAAIAAVQREAGYGIAPSVWAELESGTRRPSDEQRERLTRFFGSEPQAMMKDDEPSRVIAINELTQAIRAQTEAMQAVVREMGESREAQKGRDEALAVVLDALAEQIGALRPVLAGKQQ